MMIGNRKKKQKKSTFQNRLIAADILLSLVPVYFDLSIETKLISHLKQNTMKNEVSEPVTSAATETAMTTQDMLNQWQGHRRLTRRTIEAFPEKELFTFSVGGMRPFADLVKEMLGMAKPGLEGTITRKWDKYSESSPITTKAELLAKWDETTAYIDENWSRIPAGRFGEDDVAFGQWPGKIYWMMMYFIDNEIHHRGQGYVYLRSLGVEPPPFWER